jgi:hypothetical protein
MSSAMDWKKQTGISGAHTGLYPKAMNIVIEVNPIRDRSVLTTGIPVTEQTMLTMLREMTATNAAVKTE